MEMNPKHNWNTNRNDIFVYTDRGAAEAAVVVLDATHSCCSVAQRAIPSVSLFVYCASPAAPVMSHCQRLMPNQCLVLPHPPPPLLLLFLHPLFFPSALGQPDSWHKWLPNTVIYKRPRLQKTARGRHLSLGQVSASRLSLPTAGPTE